MCVESDENTQDFLTSFGQVKNDKKSTYKIKQNNKNEPLNLSKNKKTESLRYEFSVAYFAKLEWQAGKQIIHVIWR